MNAIINLIMITKKEFELLTLMLNKDGKITFKEQKIFINDISFYRAMKHLKKHSFIISLYINKCPLKDSRIKIYEITLKGIELCKLLNG